MFVSEKVFSRCVEAYVRGVECVRSEMAAQLVTETETYLGAGWDE
jgi:hypothetical protein